MKILMVHNYLRPPSGENTVFEQESALLRSKGHNVITYVRRNSEIEAMGWLDRGLMPLSALWSSSACGDLKTLIERENPEVAHFHNIFPLVSPAAYRVCSGMNLPVVQTLHHFRIVCPGALLFKRNEVCEACAEMKFSAGIRYGCYRNSRLQTAGMAAVVSFHRAIRTWQNTVDLYIALSDFAVAKYRQLGFPSQNFFVKTNFLQNPIEPVFADSGYGVYIGRLGEEKGIAILLSALKSCPEIPFKIIGDGPIRDFVIEAMGQPGFEHVEYLGVRDHRECMACLSGSRFLVLPSQWYEGVPMVLLEAMAAGKPAIVTNIGVLPQMIEDGFNGLIFEPKSGQGLIAAMKRLNGNPDESRVMGRRSRSVFDERYTSEVNYSLLMQAYQKAASTHEGKKRTNG
jgi:glycosyltransferase involved in cell wall biosynthesis